MVYDIKSNETVIRLYKFALNNNSKMVSLGFKLTTGNYRAPFKIIINGNVNWFISKQKKKKKHQDSTSF